MWISAPLHRGRFPKRLMLYLNYGISQTLLKPSKTAEFYQFLFGGLKNFKEVHILC